MSLILDGTNGLSDVDGSAATPAIRGSDANTGVFFGTDIVGVSTGGTERVRVDASGNVGIGTSSPAQKLSVDGNIVATGSIDCGTQFLGLSTDSAAAPSFSFTGDTDTGLFRADANQVALTTGGTARLTVTTAQFTGTLPWRGQNGTVSAPAISASADTNTGIFFPAADTIAFAEGGVEAMRINAAGQTQFKGTALVAATVNTETATNMWGLAIRDSNSNNSLVLFENSAGGAVGTITRSGSTTVYSTSSDYRLKHDIQPMTGALATVVALKPVTYKWNADNSSGQGFIAHELQEVVPECVVGTKDAVDANGNPFYQGIDTSFLVATLTAAIQEQQAIITALTARVEALEGVQP